MTEPTDEQLPECLKSYFNNEYITKASIDFEKSCVYLTIVPPGSLERIKIDCVLADKEND
jgi:hypothetical protein